MKFISFLLLALGIFSHLSYASYINAENHIDIKQTLNIFLSQKTKLSHPLELSTESNKSSLYLMYLIQSSVFVLDHSNSWECRLCTEFPTPENKRIKIKKQGNQKDEVKIKIEFSKEFSWGDGTPITGRDVYFTWQVAVSQNKKILGKSFFEKISKVVIDKFNPRKVSIYLKDKKYLFSTWGEIILLPSHLEEPIWDKYFPKSEQYFKNSLYVKDPFHPGLYSGPYVPKSYSSNYHIFDLHRNPNYLAASLPYDKIIVRTKKNQNINFQLLSKNPRHQVLFPEVLFPINKYPINFETEIPDAKNLKMVLGDSTQFEHLGFNLRSPIIKDIRVRKALAHGFDKEHILSKIYQKSTIPAIHFLPPQDNNFLTQTGFSYYDEKLSHQLLEEAKWHLDPSTKLRMKHGKKLEITLTTSQHPLRIKTANFLAKSWKNLGITTHLKIHKESKFTHKIIPKKHFSDIILFSRNLPSDTNYYHIFHSHSVPTIRNQYSGYNIYTWIDSRVDRILENLKYEYSPNKRYLQMTSLQKLFLEEIPAIPLFFYLKKAVVSNSVANLTIPGNQLFSSQYIHNWHRRKSRMRLGSFTVESVNGITN